MQSPRSHLIVPGSDRSAIVEALRSTADSVIVDLEDTVAPNAKSGARKTALDTFDEIQPDGEIRSIRVNGLDTSYGVADVEELASTDVQVDVLTLPDVRNSGEVTIVDDILDDYGSDLKIHPLIEKPQALVDAHNVAGLSDRIYGITFAAIDFQMNMGMSIIDDNDLSVPRYLLSIAANSSDVFAIDAPNLAAVNDDDTTRTEARAAKSIGFDGKFAMNPRQAEIINDVFVPSHDEIRRAARFIEAFEAADEGLVEIEGTAVDKPVIDQLRDILDRATEAGIDVDRVTESES